MLCQRFHWMVVLVMIRMNQEVTNSYHTSGHRPIIVVAPVTISQTEPVVNGKVPSAHFVAPERVPTLVTSDQTAPQKIPLTFSLAVTDSHNSNSQNLPDSNTAVTIECDRNDQSTVEKVKGQSSRVFSIFDFFGYEHISHGLKKWLSGENSPLDLDVNWLRSTQIIQQAEKTNEIRFEQKPIMKGEFAGDSLIKTVKSVIKDGQTRQFGDTWNVAVSKPLKEMAANRATADAVY